MFFQNPTPIPPVMPDVRPGVLVSSIKQAGSATFEKSETGVPGEGGFIRDFDTGYGFHITGTTRDGKLIRSIVIDSSGRSIGEPTSRPKFKITDDSEIIRMFDLSRIEGDSTQFRRPGYNGLYVLGKDSDGTCTLFFKGGTHVSGEKIPAQTFHHGAWDLNRTQEPERVAENRAAPKQLSLPQPANPSPQKPEAPTPINAVAWSEAIQKIGTTALGIEHGFPGCGERAGIAAVFYHQGVMTNFHKHYPGADLDRMTPFSKISEEFGAAKPFTCRADDAVAVRTLRDSSAALEARVVRTERKSIFLFSTQSSVDGFGILMIEGGEHSLPVKVQAAYEAAEKESGNGILATNIWFELDKGSRNYAMVRSNGQVVFFTPGNTEGELFDPLQAILRNAEQTKAQESRGEREWKSLKDVFSGADSLKLRTVQWKDDGHWIYTTPKVPTVLPPQVEPAPPE